MLTQITYFLAIAENCDVWLFVGFVMQGHIMENKA